MPPSIATEEIIKRSVMDSFKKRTPPSAAMTGTLNCTDAARVAVNPRNAAYHMA